MDLLDLGTKTFIKGFYLEGGGTSTIVLLPKEKAHYTVNFTETTEYEYKEIVRQLDIQEAKIFSKHHGTRHIVRRSQRNLDQRVTWKVHKRDNYTCRYCGVDGVPMSYDHVKLWENLGMNTVENGVCACVKCNQKRGNTDFKEWLKGNYYLRESINISDEVKELNNELALKYERFDNRVSKRRR
jgi:hypothetical protein